MAGWNEAYPYVIQAPPFPIVMDWCDEAFGKGEWQYFNSEFRFQTEQDFMLFKLKWL